MARIGARIVFHVCVSSMMLATSVSIFWSMKMLTAVQNNMENLSTQVVYGAAFRRFAKMEGKDVVALSLSAQKSTKLNMTVALCHKSLFGDFDMRRVIEWVTFHHLLGFDRIFISYIPGVEKTPQFEDLQSLPYVTLFLYEKGKVNHWKGLVTQDSEILGTEEQMELEAKCINEDARGFDWVMLADADEYLWYNQYIGVKEFLSQYPLPRDYLSFGKVMYSMLNRVPEESVAYALSSNFSMIRYPFHPGHYCLRHEADGVPARICVRDRSKIMLRPGYHRGHVRIHGTHNTTGRGRKSLHFDPAIAHLKEWKAGTRSSDFYAFKATKIRPPANFTVQSDAEVYVHGFDVYKKNTDGSVTFSYDRELLSWFDYVASRGYVYW